MASGPELARLVGWGTLLVEVGYPLLVWLKWTRTPGALATIGMHVGIAVALGLVSFAGVMIVAVSGDSSRDGWRFRGGECSGECLAKTTW